jgi:hypothetical protein
MEPKHCLLAAFVALLALSNHTAAAQMIYKQVDDDGRVSFTDQPKPGARTVASYPGPGTASVSPSGVQARSDREAAAPETRTSFAAEPVAIRAVEAPRVTEISLSTADQSQRENENQQSSLAAKASPAVAGGGLPRLRSGEVERAVFTYSALNTPQAVQVDALESARRARIETSKIRTPAPVLVVQPAAPDREPAAGRNGLDFFYAIWALTFTLLAAGLLYFGWRVLELILGRAFPQWEIGTA